jgi:hypothetical protein
MIGHRSLGGDHGGCVKKNTFQAVDIIWQQRKREVKANEMRRCDFEATLLNEV